MTKPIMLVLLCLFGICFTDPIIVLNKDMQQPIVDMNNLLQHLAQNKQLQSYIVQGFEGAQQELVSSLKELLREVDLDKEDISSFISDHKNLEDKIQNEETLDINKAIRLLKNKANGVFVFKSYEQEQKLRILQNPGANVTTISQLFNNMTPATLSALFVTLFLIIVLLIGVSCLYNIKTNDKFGRSNLWVGKQS